MVDVNGFTQADIDACNLEAAARDAEEASDDE
jgi:hypothetical protein